MARPSPSPKPQYPEPTQIGLVACVAFGVGTTVGGGVFTLSGTAVNLAGPGAVASYILAGAVMCLCALSFIVVSTRAGEGESGYAPVGTILGPFWRFIVMWAFYLNGATIIAYLTVSFGDYLSEYFLPAAGTLLLALAATVLVTALNLGPTAVVARAETWIVGIKLALLVLFSVWGLLQLRLPQLERPLPEGAGGVFSAAALLFTAYTGFNVITNMAGSVKDPRRTVPRAIMLTILVSGLVYLGTVLAMTASGITRFTSTGVSQAAEIVMGAWGGLLVAFAACLSTLSGANANVLGASEIMLRMVARGDVPPVLGRHTRRGHPYVSVLLLGIITVLLVVLNDTTFVVSVANVAAIIAMVVVSVAAAVLGHRKWPGEGARLPLGPAVPVLAAVAAAAQLPSLDPAALATGFLLTGLGAALYFARHVQRGGAGTQLHANRQIDSLGTPLMSAVRRRPNPRRTGGPDLSRPSGPP
ncbi:MULTISPECIES: APC family permease [unclassified Arthrobacter]|uniref:APC family permease n=1 Tax=unclassified Arthrobacter TaxID=235627 RepID=UPI0024DFE91C|nr:MULTISPECIES: APC family permease [unclassified Arthrobacter]MCC9145351.1 APC family permease [Arthrobacter sp. zg-Y919]MDK1276579.1 APC family permease [Arthrobacter sp. zg.Y919]WIB01832.1 APC family permease [Arthrobacter sp. zg-Y919]